MSALYRTLNGEQKTFKGYLWRGYTTDDSQESQQPKPKYYGKIAKVCPKTDKVLKVYDSPMHVARSLGHEHASQVSSLYRVLQGNQKTFLGCHWRRHDPSSEMENVTAVPAEGTPSTKRKSTGTKTTSVKKRKVASTGKVLEQICPKTGKVINTFSSTKEAAINLGKSGQARTGIQHVLAGRRATCWGYEWRYRRGASRTGKAKDRTVVSSKKKSAKSKSSRNNKVVEQLCCKTGTVLDVFPSVSEATKSFGRDPNCSVGIYHTLSGRQKTCFGYKWRYQDVDTTSAAAAAAVTKKSNNEQGKGKKRKSFLDDNESYNSKENNIDHGDDGDDDDRDENHDDDSSYETSSDDSHGDDEDYDYDDDYDDEAVEYTNYKNYDDDDASFFDNMSDDDDDEYNDDESMKKSSYKRRKTK